MKNDIERAVDTVLSGLTVDAAQQEEIVRNAIRNNSAPQHTSKTRDLKLKMSFSLSFPLPHLVVAALVVIIVTLAPLLVPLDHDPFQRYSSEDGQDYIVTGNDQPTPQPGAIAAPGELGFASYEGTSLEKAEQAFGARLPRFTWLPENTTLIGIVVNTTPDLRKMSFHYQKNDSFLNFRMTDYITGEFGMHYIFQDGEGEYQTLSNGQEVYTTTNCGRTVVSWHVGYKDYLLTGDISLEDALRMIESLE